MSDQSFSFVFVCQAGRLEVDALLLALSLEHFVRCDYELVAALPTLIHLLQIYSVNKLAAEPGGERAWLFGGWSATPDGAGSWTPTLGTAALWRYDTDAARWTRVDAEGGPGPPAVAIDPTGIERKRLGKQILEGLCNIGEANSVSCRHDSVVPLNPRAERSLAEV